MKASHKLVLVGAAAAGLAVLVMRSRRKSAINIELTVSRAANGNCACFEVTNNADGTVSNRRVPNARCLAEPNLATEMQQCANLEGPFNTASDIVLGFLDGLVG
jgi:hypothetical protein